MTAQTAWERHRAASERRTLRGMERYEMDFAFDNRELFTSRAMED